MKLQNRQRAARPFDRIVGRDSEYMWPTQENLMIPHKRMEQTVVDKNGAKPKNKGYLLARN